MDILQVDGFVLGKGVSTHTSEKLDQTLAVKVNGPTNPPARTIVTLEIVGPLPPAAYLIHLALLRFKPGFKPSLGVRRWICCWHMLVECHSCCRDERFNRFLQFLLGSNIR